MQIQRLRHIHIAACLLLAATALAGCGNGQQSSSGTSGIPANAKPAQVRLALKQQQAQRIAYYKQHPGAGGRGPGVTGYSARMGVIPPHAQPGEVQQALQIQAQQQAAFYKAHPSGHL
jgi:hypothetical protein